MFNMPEATKDMLSELRLESNLLNAVIANRDGLVFSSYLKKDEAIYQFEIPEAIPSEGILQEDGNFIDFFFPVKDNSETGAAQRLGVICLRFDNQELTKVQRQFINTAISALAVGLLFSIILSSYLQRSISNPLKKLLLFMQRISYTNNYTLRVKDDGDDEIAELSLEFNKMLEQIEERDQSLEVAKGSLEGRVQSRTEELRKRTDELEASNKELEQFAYVASHDLQEPLRSIGGFTQLISRRYKGKLDEEADEYIQYITDGVDRMQMLIKDLLLFSRVGRTGEELKLARFDHILDKTLLDLQFAIAESETEIVRDELPSIVVDEKQIGYLFQNLISNAIKFRSERKPLINIKVEDLRNYWQFSIQDNGIGVEEEFKDRIFLIFQRLHAKDKYQGSGIGLAICKKIVELHGGKIWIESKPDVGSTFFFTIGKNMVAGEHLSPTENS